jgi:hypothetical protein
MSSYTGDVAREVDRLVIAGHQLAGTAPKPPPLDAMTAHSGLLNTVAVVLLAGPVTRDDLGRVVPYLTPEIEDALLDNNVAEGVITGRDPIELTDAGHALAAATVALQESVVATAWASADETLTVVDSIAPDIVARAAGGDAPSMPSAFHLFAAVVDRPSLPGRVLRTITAMRYWRADAHRAALLAAGLAPFEAHALNRLWRARTGVDGVGQGRDEPGARGVAALEERGLAKDGEITADGFDARQSIEDDTNARTEPLYQPLDDRSRTALLDALAALPG